MQNLDCAGEVFQASLQYAANACGECCGMPDLRYTDSCV